MNARAVVLFALAIHFAFAPFAAVAATLIPEVPGHPSRLIMYLAKGAPNSCGPGCDRWIAIEGTVDADAAWRVRQFLNGVKDTQRPIYFHSPGGEVRQAFAIGRMLRARKAIGRVGRTIASACAAGSQIDDACLKIKTAGSEVQAELATRYAMCNSACGTAGAMRATQRSSSQSSPRSGFEVKIARGGGGSRGAAARKRSSTP